MSMESSLIPSSPTFATGPRRNQPSSSSNGSGSSLPTSSPGPIHRSVELSWPESPDPLHWPVANHGDVREAFAQLLARDAPRRFLPIVGPSETGKSHITRQMLANALTIPDLACGRFDFKGTTGMDAEVRAFVQELGVNLPPENPQLNIRLGHVLDQLRKSRRPTLLIFDTYEAVGDAKDWIEKQLLPSLIRATWLRVVIAGQRVPASTGVVWASAAVAPIHLKPPPPQEWFEYGKQHRPGLTLDVRGKSVSSSPATKPVCWPSSLAQRRDMDFTEQLRVLEGGPGRPREARTGDRGSRLSRAAGSRARRAQGIARGRGDPSLV